MCKTSRRVRGTCHSATLGREEATLVELPAVAWPAPALLVAERFLQAAMYCREQTQIELNVGALELELGPRAASLRPPTKSLGSLSGYKASSRRSAAFGTRRRPS